MPTRNTTRKLVDVLPRRSEVFGNLVESPKDKQTLVADLDLSRSTVDRAVSELESLTLVAHCDDEIEPTVCGRLAVEEYRQFEARVTDLWSGADGHGVPVERLIAAVATRPEMVEVLLDEPHEKRSLVDHLDVSRSTVDRATRELETLGLIEYAPANLRPTEIGRDVIREYKAFETRLDGLVAASDLLTALNPNVNLKTELLTDAEIVPAEPVAPHVPGTHLKELLQGVDRITCLGRAYSYAPAMDLFHALVIQKGVQMETVFPTELLEFQQATNPKKITQIIEQDHVEAFTIEKIPFGLFIGETEDHTWICLIVYNSENNIKGMILNTSDEAIKWGKRTFGRYKRQAERVNVEAEPRTASKY